jgi:hypothetical protein
MTDTLKGAVRAAVLRLLDPLVKWLLAAGMGVGDLVALVKIAYVRAAREEGQGPGAERQIPNISRIAILTGLTRVEVSRLLADETAERPHDVGRRQRAERVLSGWWNDSTFQDRLGEPAILPVRGSKRSFAALVERYVGGNWRVRTILNELLRVGAVRRLPDGRLKALSRTYATVRWDPAGVAAFGEQMAELCATLLHNLNFPDHPYTVRRVLNAQLNPEYVPMLRREFEGRLRVLANSVDRRLNDSSHTVKGEETAASSLGLMVYLFQPHVIGGTTHADEELVGPEVIAARRRARAGGLKQRGAAR